MTMEWWFGKTKYIMTADYTKDVVAAGTSSSSCREVATMESEIMFNEEIAASTSSVREAARVDIDQMLNKEIQGGGGSLRHSETAWVLVEDQMIKNEIEKEVTSSNIEAVVEVKSVEMLNCEIVEDTSSSSAVLGGRVASEMLKSEIAEDTSSRNASEEAAGGGEPEMMFNSSSRDAAAGEGSSQTNFCGICMEDKEREEMFINQTCPHTFCSYCMSQHIESKIQEDQVIMVMCPEPNCRAALEPHICKGIIQAQVFDRWCKALCESLFPGSQRLYCPFKDCSAMLVLDDEGGDPEVVIREAECLHCRRLFCAVCAVPWHAEIHCEEFQRLNKDEREATDLMVINLAKTREWKRCPSCKYYVEKTDGCLHITCRCTYELCYRCGGKWNDEDHDVCS